MELHVLALLQCLYTCTYCLLVTYEVFVVPKQMNSTVVISGTIGWLPPQCVAAQRQCCSPGRSQLLPPLTCSTSCSTDARKKSNQSLRNPVTKKCMVFNRRKSRNKYRNKSILWVPTSNRPIVREGFISRQVSGLLSGPDHQHYSHIISPAFTWEKAKL